MSKKILIFVLIFILLFSSFTFASDYPSFLPPLPSNRDESHILIYKYNQSGSIFLYFMNEPILAQEHSFRYNPVIKNGFDYYIYKSTYSDWEGLSGAGNSLYYSDLLNSKYEILYSTQTLKSPDGTVFFSLPVSIPEMVENTLPEMMFRTILALGGIGILILSLMIFYRLLLGLLNRQSIG